MNWFAFGIAFTSSLYAVFWQAAWASGNHMLNVYQMQTFRKIREGLPFLMHGGVWGDVVIISGLMGCIVGFFWDTWAWWQIAIFLALGFAGSYGMHLTYLAAPWPEAHVEGGHLTDVGDIHLGYMAVAFAVLLLYYVRPVEPWEIKYMTLVSVLLVSHVVIGTHVPLGLAKLCAPERFAWYPGTPLTSSGTWGAIAGTFVLTFGRTALACVWH